MGKKDELVVVDLRGGFPVEVGKEEAEAMIKAAQAVVAANIAHKTEVSALGKATDNDG